MKYSEAVKKAGDYYIEGVKKWVGSVNPKIVRKYKEGMEQWYKNKIGVMRKSLKQSERLAKKYWDWYKRLKKEKYKELAIKHEVRQIRLKHYIQMEQEIRELEKKLRKRKK